jgi:hypothetical protein
MATLLVLFVLCLIPPYNYECEWQKVQFDNRVGRSNLFLNCKHLKCVILSVKKIRGGNFKILIKRRIYQMIVQCKK